MFNSFFSRKPQPAHASTAERVSEFVANDSSLVFPNCGEADLSTLSGERQSRAAYLLELIDEGYARRAGNQILLPWEQLFSLLANPDHEASIPLLGLPAELDLRPLLASEGSLADPDFRVIVRGWRHDSGTAINGALARKGALFELDGARYRLPRPTWKLLNAIRALALSQRDHPGERTNQLGWAEIHREAKEARASFDGFLEKTIVLRPETLRIRPKRSEHQGVHIVEVVPEFDQAPPNWLATFDSFPSVPERYSIASESGGITHILLTPEVKSVLQQVRQLPARRVAGDKALQLLRNPFACLGDDANKVLDHEQFERDREAAGISFLRFRLYPQLDSHNKISGVAMQLEPLSAAGAEPETVLFSTPSELAPFVHELEIKLAAGMPCGFWRGYELELSDLDQAQVDGVRELLRTWRAQINDGLFEDVFDLSQYGSRVIGIGAATTVTSPFLVRDSGQKWLPPELLDSLGLDGALLAKWDTDNEELLEQFERDIEFARSEHKETVVVPGLEAVLPLDTACAIAIAWAAKLRRRQVGVPADPRPERSVLQIDDNIEELRYSESSRADALHLASTAAPVLPAALVPGVHLRDHQLHGVAWLQHLFHSSPGQASGCLLADDMGLGKTLQLLTFIASYLELPGSADPVLVVAPVSLLDNWENEVQRFFVPGFASILKLYGAELSAVKFKKSQLPADVTERGIFNLLRPDWRQGKQIVLTTYETLRDHEFSLARQRWAIVVCDEAQKIKNPAALVTQAARALPARFKIACTGTPVENSLTDLWCLFDFIQPGLLGALNEFGRKYRPPADAETCDDDRRLDELRSLVAPQILRRMKHDVAKDLPAKLESSDCKSLAMSSTQLKLYRNEMARFKLTQQAMENDGGRGNATILGLLHTMKMICAHPHAVHPEGELMDISPKLRWLMTQLSMIEARSEKVIIFTELRDVQRALKLAILDRFGIVVTVVNGDTSASATSGRSRQQLIDEFQKQPGFGIIILSTTAVGFGVNVQAANHVIHFTRCWNPAKEDQATDRAYRIGQTRDVHVYYPTIAGDGFESFEQKLDSLLAKKRALASDILNGSGDVNVLDLVDR